ncbi:hypothetical protein B0H13DRAFT_2006545, partial [Mycena leptocephala]
MLCATASKRPGKVQWPPRWPPRCPSQAPHEQIHERPAAPKAPFTSAPLVQTRTVTPRRAIQLSLPPVNYPFVYLNTDINAGLGCKRVPAAKRIPPPELLEEALATIDPTGRRERLRTTRAPLHNALRRCEHPCVSPVRCERKNAPQTGLMSAPNWFYASPAMVFTLY